MITFVGMASRTSGMIRGIQMASRLKGGQFIELRSMQPAVNDVVILLRNYDKATARHYKDKGHIVGYDIADMPVGDAYFRGERIDSISKYCHPECDFFIVNNDVCLEEVRNVTSRPAYVIPHHNTNFDRKRIPFRNESLRVGYAGLPEQVSHATELSKMLGERGAEFVSAHPNSREECDSLFMSIDIGIVFMDETAQTARAGRGDLVALTKKYKPNTKLTNFQSYGIPTICVEYESYKQFGEEAYVKVETFDDACEELKMMLKDNDYRQHVGDKGFVVGQKFHIDDIAFKYEKLRGEMLR